MPTTPSTRPLTLVLGRLRGPAALVALALLITGCAVGNYQPAKSVKNDPELGGRLTEVARAFETRDIEKIASHYASNDYAVSFETPYRFATGVTEHRQVLAELLAKVDTLKVTFAPDFGAKVDGDRAWTMRDFKVEGTTKAGAAFSYAGWHSAVWNRQNGKWVIWYEHFGGNPKVTLPPPPPPPPPPAATPAPAPEPEPTFGDVFYDFDKWNIRADQVATLEANAEILKARPGLRILIEGHCDERGGESYNNGLGERRAQASKNHLVMLGIDPSRIETVSYGKTKPFELGRGEKVWKQNRRAHFVALK